MHHAGAGRFAVHAKPAVAVADEQVAAGQRLKHKREVLAACECRRGINHLLVTDQIAGHAVRKFCLCLGIHEHGIVALIINLGTHTKALRLCVYQRTNPCLQRVSHFAIQRAHAQLQRRAGRDHVVGDASVKRAHGNHRRRLRIDVARDDGLQRHHDACRRHNWIGRAMGERAVATNAVQRDRHVFGGGHGWAVTEVKRTLRLAGGVVHGKDCVARILRK